MTTKVSFWLVPAETDKIFFENLIKQLAQKYHAPVFTPHVTIYFGAYPPTSCLADLIQAATVGIQPFSLRIDRLLSTNQFTKTFFVQFQSKSVLTNLSATLRNASSQASGFTLDPHLSLVYQSLAPAQKQDLLNQVNLPMPEVYFDQVWAIATPEQVQTREDVESWQVLATQKLIST